MNNNKLNRKDFISDQEVKWCHGCGDFNVLRVMQSVLANLGKPKEQSVFISGIGCSSRFPYYLDTYGFHTIHGRAPAIATGVKAVNPELDVWVVTGDGDALSIGGNHFIHAIRRNQDIKILLFNNEVYGLTKGQYSPTSTQGAITKSTPQGAIDYPVRPLALAASVDASFIARTSDNDPKHMTAVLEAAARHKGTAVVEILQNCVIFNDKVHEPYNGPKNRSEHLLYLETGQPLLFGKNKEQALCSNGFGFDVAPADGSTPFCHDSQAQEPSYAFALANLNYPDYPVPVGIFRQVIKPTFDQLMAQQQHDAIVQKGESSLKELLFQGSYSRE